MSGKLTVTGNSALPVPNVTVKATPTGDIATRGTGAVRAAARSATITTGPRDRIRPPCAR